MSELVNVEVTADDIRNGERANCERCPIALAVTRAIPPGWKHLLVQVGTDAVSLVDEKENDICFADLPEKAQEFVEEFDKEFPSQPFAFDLTFQE